MNVSTFLHLPEIAELALIAFFPPAFKKKVTAKRYKMKIFLYNCMCPILYLAHRALAADNLAGIGHRCDKLISDRAET